MVICKQLRGSSKECVQCRPSLRRLGRPLHRKGVLAAVPGALASITAQRSDEAINGALSHGEAGHGGPLRPPLANGAIANQLLWPGGSPSRCWPLGSVLEVVGLLGWRPPGICLREDALCTHRRDSCGFKGPRQEGQGVRAVYGQCGGGCSDHRAPL
jgi:hypothetical protein